MRHKISTWGFVLALLFLTYGPMGLSAQNAQWVNPFIGTDKSCEFSKWGNYGGTFPGAVAPWGMLQLTPETSRRPAEMGYYYSDPTILYFSCHSHSSGYPNGSNGRLHLSFWPSDCLEMKHLEQGRPFQHKDETARPGYYAVHFENKDYIEMTATAHSGLFRYQSDASKTTLMIAQGGKLTVKDNRTLHASLEHAIVSFDKPMSHYTLRNDTAFIEFQRKDTRRGLQVQVSVSANSFEKSEENAVHEIANRTFEEVCQQTYTLWDQELNCIQVEGGTLTDKINFYTALYHACLQPCLVSDANTDRTAYGLFSPWDTFRSLHPMLTLLKPERQQSMVDFVLRNYQHTGKLPKGPMTGFHILPILLDSYVKGTANTNAEALLEASETWLESYKDNQMLQLYRTYGFIPADQERSVSITSELAYNDWVMSRMAHLAGNKEKASAYAQRSLNYQHLFDAATGYLLPRKENEFLLNCGELGYQESDRWTASYFIPHNIQDLINRSGGDERFIQRLAEAFDQGKIIFDNEPVFHYPYLFTYGGRPDLTTHYVHQILHTNYSNAPGGITGNDDLGSMSSWYVLSAIGLFPICPGSDEYLLTEPLFDRISFSIGGKTFTIQKRGHHSGESVPCILLDGKELNRWFLTHQELVDAKSLVYDNTRPVRDFSKLHKPYSLTQGQPQFQVDVQTPKWKKIPAGQLQQIVFTVKNEGEGGLYLAQLKEQEKIIAEKAVAVEANQSLSDTLSFTLYKEGSRQLNLSDHSFNVTVNGSTNLQQALTCHQIQAPSLVPFKEKYEVAFFLQNRSGKICQQVLPVFLNDSCYSKLTISLEPGEQKEYTLVISDREPGIQKLRILNAVHLTKVYATPQDACLLSLDYDPHHIKTVPDLSGFNNDGTCHGNLRWGKGYMQTDEQAYLTLPSSKSLMTATSKLTLLTWIAPQKYQPDLGYADFFTKGDYINLKMEGPHTLVFFAGGWGRGMCQVKVPEDWYKQWHLVAGVCTGETLQLYIDGKLMQEIKVKGKLENTEVPWNIGRNAETPFSRFWDMKIAKTRIYGTALTDKDILNIYKKEVGLFR